MERMLIYGLVVLIALGSAAGWGYMKGSERLFKYQAEQAKEKTRIAGVRQVVSEKVVTRYVKVAGETQIVTNTVEKEVVKYAELNPGLCLDVTWGRLHDTSADNRLPDAAGKADGKGRTAPPAALALKTVTENYAACHRNADRLDALQDWVKQQQVAR